MKVRKSTRISWSRELTLDEPQGYESGSMHKRERESPSPLLPYILILSTHHLLLPLVPAPSFRVSTLLPHSFPTFLFVDAEQVGLGPTNDTKRTSQGLRGSDRGGRVVTCANQCLK